MISSSDLPAADLKATFQLQILGVKKNPQSPMYTQLGVMTKGTVIEVNVSELGMVTTGGKVVFGKYAQITNNPENDGCINAVLRASLFCSYFLPVSGADGIYSCVDYLRYRSLFPLPHARMTSPHLMAHHDSWTSCRNRKISPES